MAGGATGSSTAQRVRAHFDRKARAFDGVYEEDRRALQGRVRPAIFHRFELALAEVAAHEAPSVLDVGCGPGRVAEQILDAGVSRYVGVDFSQPMLELAADRLRRFGDAITLVHGDFLEAPLAGPFDVVLALGLFDYVAEPAPLARRMHECGGRVVIATFPVWDRLKGPIRKLRYEVLADCPIFDYTEQQAHRLFRAAGFGSVETLRQGRSDLVVRAAT